jgi:hypothetical protein
MIKPGVTNLFVGRVAMPVTDARENVDYQSALKMGYTAYKHTS